jgi:RNA polymerase sigma factor (sigma-70 family)
MSVPDVDPTKFDFDGHDKDRFSEVVTDVEQRVRRSLVARFGVEVGNDSCNDALEWAWSHQDQLISADNPAGLLYRVGQSSSRRYLRWRRAPRLPAETMSDNATTDLGLGDAMSSLSEPQRVSVLLVHGHRYTYDEVAEILGVSTAAVRNHVHRGLRRLRTKLGE